MPPFGTPLFVSDEGSGGGPPPAGPGGISPPKVIADTWYIDPNAGNDANPGTTALLPLKTWARLQEIFGTWTRLLPTPGPILKIFVVPTGLPNRMPDSDPLTFMNFMASGTSAIAFATYTVLTTGAFDATHTNDPGQLGVTSPTPGTVSHAGLDSTLLGKIIRVLTGTGARSRANIVLDNGGGSVQVSEWRTGGNVNDGISGIVYGNAPAPGDTYEVVSGTEVFFGPGIVGYDSSNLFPGNPVAGIGGLALVGFWGSLADPLNVGTSVLPVPANNQTFVNLADCVFDNVTVFGAGFYQAAGCCFRSNAFPNAGTTIVRTFCSQAPLTVAEGGTGSSQVFNAPGSISVIDGDEANVGDPALVLSGGAAAYNNQGFVVAGPTSWWNVNFPIAAVVGGTFQFPAFSPVFGAVNVPQLYGDGNGAPINFEGGTVPIASGDLSQATAVLPNLLFPNEGAAFQANPALDGTIAWLFTADMPLGGGADAGRQGLPFDVLAGAYAAAPVANTWANLSVPIGLGGFQGPSVPVPGGGHHSFSNSQRPENLFGPAGVMTFTGNTL